MEGQLAVPFHFAVEFLILAVGAGAAFDAVRRYRSGHGWSALGQMAGFASLVAAQVLHGALIIESDGDVPLLVLRAVGFGLLALPPRPSPALGMPALFTAGEDAAWAVLPALAAAAAAVRGAAAHRRDQEPATFAYSAAFACFAAGEIALVAAAPGGGGVLAVAHAARGVGALLLARWLWTPIVRSVRLRFVAAFVTALVLVVVLVAAALTQVIGESLERTELRRARTAAESVVASIQGRADFTASLAATYANSFGSDFPKGAAHLVGLSRVLLSRIAPPDVELIMFVDARGRVLASARAERGFPPVDQPTALGIAGSGVVKEALPPRNRPTGSVVSVGPRAVLALGAAPARARLGDVVGAVVIGYLVDDRFVAQAKPGATGEVSLIKGEEVVASSLKDRRAASGLVAGDLRDRIRRRVGEEGVSLEAPTRLGGERFFSAYVPLRQEDGFVVAVLAVSRDAASLTGSQRAVNRTLFLIALAASAFAALLAWLSGGRVTRPIRSLTAAAQAVRGGDLETRASIEGIDEVGALGTAFNEMATSLRRMTDDLREAATQEATLRARMEAIMQSMGDGLVATDADGTVVAFNRAAEQMVGRRGDRAVGRKLSDVLVGLNGDGRPLAEAALSGAGETGSASLTAADGRQVPVAFTTAPLRDGSGRAVGRVIVLHDVSREREAERMKSEFLSNVSHELRTPLTPIKGYTEILKRRQFPREKAESFLDGILESTARLERIVEILVDFAAMEAGRLKPRMEPIDLRVFVGEILDEWRERDVRHRFVRKVPAGLPAVQGDPRLLRKCIDELVDNAVKFSPNGGSVEIDARVASPNGTRRRPSMVRISIRDRGIGIPPEQMAQLFQDFRQLDGSETRAYGGLGLGLAYARRVAVAHRGDILAESTPGRGSTFTLLLPLADIGKGSASRPAGRRTGART